MWKYLAIQGILFFLFFQPALVAIRAMRVFLISIAIFAMVTSYLYASMDPFAWVLYCFGISLTYLMAQKALRWVSVNRQMMREEVGAIDATSKNFANEVAGKNARIQELQSEIYQVSHIYDKVKEMSRALEFLDLFVDLSEVLMENFSLEKSRLLMLKGEKESKKTIDCVYQLDKKHFEFSAQDKSLLSRDVMFRGEVYPFDLRLVEILQKNPRDLVYWTAAEAEADAKIKIPDIKGSFIVLPVMTPDKLSAVLTLEGIEHKDYPSAQILMDRFMYEFQRIKLYADVQRLAITDWLTGAYVRRYFFKRLEEELSRSARFNLKFTFLMIDLDNFKQCNDQHGHLAGDAILKQTADLIKETLREVDLVGRYGGEEFAAILLDTDENEAMYVAERIRKNIENRRFRAYDLSLRITASIGFATYHPNIQEAGEIVDWADSALYQAKRQGKNRVCAYINR